MELSTISTQSLSKKLQYFDLSWQGETRRTELFIPENIKMPSPIVLMLHGAGGNSLMAAKQTDWCAKADKEGFIVAFPNGLPFDPDRSSSFLRNPQVWNSGVERGGIRVSDTDDVGFIGELIDQLKIKYSIDERKIFAAGFSNGGGMCWRLALELSEKLTAMAAVCSYLTVSEPWHQTRSIPALLIACLEDPLVPVDGGAVKDIWSRAEIMRPSVRISVEQYASFSGCSPRPTVRQINPDVSQLTYGPGKDGCMVEFYTVADAGHAYPGGPRLLSERIAGKATDALNATDVIWEFFKTGGRSVC